MKRADRRRPPWAAIVLIALAGCQTNRALVVPDGAPRAAGGAPPAAAPGATLDLPLLLEEAARANPRLSAARSRWLAARQRPAQARSLPDPMVTYTEMLEPIQTRVGPMERSLQLSQPIPFPGKLTAAGAAASEQACVKELEYHIALRDTVAEVKVVYAELVYLHRAILIVEQNQALAAQLAEKAAAAYAQQGEPAEDTLTLFDTLKAQSSLAQLAYDRITLVELLRAEESKLNALLSRAPLQPVAGPGPLRFRRLAASREELFRIARARRQEIQAAVHEVRAAGHAARLARLSQVPDFSIGVQYSFIGGAATPVAGSGDDAVGLRLGFTLPIWGAKNRARIEEARHLERAARREQRAATDDVMARISRIYFRMQNAERLVQLYEGSLLPQAEEALRISEQWHDTGRDTYGRLLEARMVWLNFQLASQRALVDHEQMVARLEQLVGISLGHLRTWEKPQ
jgi:cobalt-zinc-cadmium efflux system outer membrane protein